MTSTAFTVGQKYGTIICDPPWSYSNGGHGAAKNHYPTMSMDELTSLPVGDLAATDSVLLLWATWPQLDNALSLIKAWQFDFVTGFPWVKVQDAPHPSLFGDQVYKPTFGTGFWIRGCSEMVLISRRGNARHPDQTFVGILSENFQHSRKPENLYEYAESLPGPYLELFARRTRAGWSSWGNQLAA